MTYVHYIEISHHDNPMDNQYQTIATPRHPPPPNDKQWPSYDNPIGNAINIQTIYDNTLWLSMTSNRQAMPIPLVINDKQSPNQDNPYW
jgi:hypothetical protein